MAAGMGARGPGGRCCGGKFGGRRARDAALPEAEVGAARGWVCGAGGARWAPRCAGGTRRSRRGAARPRCCVRGMGGRGLRGCGGQRGGGRGQGRSPREPRRGTVCVPPPAGSVRGAGSLRALADARWSCPGPRGSRSAARPGPSSERPSLAARAAPPLPALLFGPPGLA